MFDAKNKALYIYSNHEIQTITYKTLYHVCIIRERFDFRDVIGHKLGGTPSLLDTKSHWVILQSNF